MLDIKNLINREIEASVVMVVGEESMQRLSFEDALRKAEDDDLDLVQFSVNNEGIPICKIVNYEKLQYNEAKKHKKAKRQELKEIKFNYVIASHDLQVKATAICRLLSEGDKVKVIVNYKGRSSAFIANETTSGIDKLNEIDKLVTVEHVMDRAPVIDGPRAYMILSPKSSKSKS